MAGTSVFALPIIGVADVTCLMERRAVKIAARITVINVILVIR